jgi:hypothetical protein
LLQSNTAPPQSDAPHAIGVEPLFGVFSRDPDTARQGHAASVWRWSTPGKTPFSPGRLLQRTKAYRLRFFNMAGLTFAA